jgi:hypothetical protein
MEGIARTRRIGALARVGTELRNRVNYRRRHSALIRNVVAWNTTCSAMDVVADTCQALHAYTVRTPIDEHDKGAAYLLAYGVLHTLYLQQDAVFWWCKSLDIAPVSGFRSPGEWARSIPELDRARVARNDSTGHPVRRDIPRNAPIAASFIVQHSLTDTGFELMQVDETRARSVFTRVHFPDLIDDQVRVLKETLERACRSLDEADAQHHRRFMHKPLTPVLNALAYPLEKLGTKEDRDWELMIGCIDEIAEALRELKASILEREEPFDEPWTYRYEHLGIALERLREYANTPASTDHRLASVLGWFIRWGIDDLRTLTEEMDDKYGSEPDANQPVVERATIEAEINAAPRGEHGGEHDQRQSVK